MDSHSKQNSSLESMKRNISSNFVNIKKAHVKKHERKSKSGKIFNVRDYQNHKQERRDAVANKIDFDKQHGERLGREAEKMNERSGKAYDETALRDVKEKYGKIKSSKKVVTTSPDKKTQYETISHEIGAGKKEEFKNYHSARQEKINILLNKLGKLAEKVKSLPNGDKKKLYRHKLYLLDKKIAKLQAKHRKQILK